MWPSSVPRFRPLAYFFPHRASVETMLSSPSKTFPSAITVADLIMVDRLLLLLEEEELKEEESLLKAALEDLALFQRLDAGEDRYT